MELRVLNYFLMVAREENITKAAQILHVTQPTLSRQLMQLEEELGVKLFKRGNHNIYLTDDGMLLKRRAQELVTLADKTRNEFLHKDEILSGEISIGSGEYHNMDSFAEALVAFRKLHPQINYQMFSGNADNIKEKLENGLLDFGILSDPVDISKYEFIRLPQTEESGIITRADSELAKKRAVTPKDLINRPVLLPSRALVQHQFEVWFGEYFDQVEIAATFNLLYNAAIMVQKGMGDALAMKLDAEYKDLVFVPLEPKLESGLVLVWKKGQVTSSATTSFIEYIRNTF